MLMPNLLVVRADNTSQLDYVWLVASDEIVDADVFSLCKTSCS